MATLRWEIWNTLPQLKRENIIGDEWESEAKARVDDYPKPDYEYEKSVVRKTESEIAQENAFLHLDDLVPNKNNAFLFDKRLK